MKIAHNNLLTRSIVDGFFVTFIRMEQLPNMIDDRHEYFNYGSLCATCEHLRVTRCKAFPNGIPIKYLSGEKKHLRIDPRQVGDVVFTNKKNRNMKGDYILNDRHQIHEIYKSLCTTCIRFDSFDYCCKAFPKGIPNKYLTGEAAHLQIDANQVGETVYEKDKKFE